jgi:hypothetical protein
MSVKLAKVIHDAVEASFVHSTRNADWPPKPQPFEELKTTARRAVMAGTRAALSWLGFPDGVEVKEGCVKHVIHILNLIYSERSQDDAFFAGYTKPAVRDALRSLGVVVDR